MLIFLMFIMFSRAFTSCGDNATIAGTILIGNPNPNGNDIDIPAVMHTDIDIYGTIYAPHDNVKFSIVVCFDYHQNCVGRCSFNTTAYVPIVHCSVKIVHQYLRNIEFSYNITNYETWCVPDSMKIAAAVFLGLSALILCAIIISSMFPVKQLCRRREYNVI